MAVEFLFFFFLDKLVDFHVFIMEIHTKYLKLYNYSTARVLRQVSMCTLQIPLGEETNELMIHGHTHL